jgi:hypothetical protein
MKMCVITLIVLVVTGCDSKRREVSLSDEMVSQKLIGVWIGDTTNRLGMRIKGDVEYHADSSVLWRGSLVEASGIRRKFADTGWWRVKSGYLVTKVTNSTFRSLVGEREYLDKLMSVTENEFTFRSAHGEVYTRHKK